MFDLECSDQGTETKLHVRLKRKFEVGQKAQPVSGSHLSRMNLSTSRQSFLFALAAFCTAKCCHGRWKSRKEEAVQKETPKIDIFL